MGTEYKSSPKRPYLLRAYFDWLVDNSFTPYLVVDAEYDRVRVPVEYVKDGQIVLNLSASAVGNLQITNDFIQFSARFRGIPQDIYIPMGAALAIYARENGDGVMFEPEDIYEESLPITDQPNNFSEAVDERKKTENSAIIKSENRAKEDHKKKTSSAHLRIVK